MPQRLSLGLLLCLPLLALASAGCGDDNFVAVRLSGEGCAAGESCEAGTACVDGVCRPGKGGPCGPDRGQCLTGLVCEEDSCRVDLEGDCSIDEECATGYLCHAGKCRSAPGGDCVTDEHCGAGLICELGMCRVAPGGTCSETVGPCVSGAECEAGQCHVSGGGACSSTGECMIGMICHNGICLAGPGQACVSDAGCADGLSCEAGLCRTLPGAACAEPTHCPVGYLCELDRCVPGVSQPCDAQNSCSGELVCEGGACQVPGGGACGGDSECVTGKVCEGGLCVSPVGGACAVHSDCPTDHDCVNAICTPAPGAACNATPDCVGDQRCVGRTCRNPPGAPCDTNDHCQLDLECVFGTCRAIHDPILGERNLGITPARLVVHRTPDGSALDARATVGPPPERCCNVVSSCSCLNYTDSVPKALSTGRTWAAGDFDGDGKDDLLFAGSSASVLFGRDFGKNDAASFTAPSLDLELTWLGGQVRVVGAGDLNDDGYDDLLLGGSPMKVAVIFGGPHLRATARIDGVDAIDPNTQKAKAADLLLTLPSTWVWNSTERWKAAYPGGVYGADVNGDGADELTFMALRYDATRVCTGSILRCNSRIPDTFTFVIAGQTGWQPGGEVIDLTQPHPKLLLKNTEQGVVYSAHARVADVDGDLRADLCLAPSHSGYAVHPASDAFVFLGDNFPPNTERTTATVDREIKRTGGGHAPLRADLGAGPQILVPDTWSLGRVYRVSPAQFDPVFDVANDTRFNIQHIEGRSSNSQFGKQIAVGDFDGDRKNDLVVSAPKGGADENSSWNRHGVVYLFYGGSPVLSATPGKAADSDAKLIGTTTDAALGEGVEVADFNGDGYDDLIMSETAPAGELYILFGGPRDRPWANP